MCDRACVYMSMDVYFSTCENGCRPNNQAQRKLILRADTCVEERKAVVLCKAALSLFDPDNSRFFFVSYADVLCDFVCRHIFSLCFLQTLPFRYLTIYIRRGGGNGLDFKKKKKITKEIRIWKVAIKSFLFVI